MTDKPSYYDREAHVECYVDYENKIEVILPSDVSLNADQAERFAQGLMLCAQWVRDNGSS